MAVAGFGDEEIDITQQENTLIVRGERKPEESKNYIYQALPSAILNVNSN